MSGLRKRNANGTTPSEFVRGLNALEKDAATLISEIERDAENYWWSIQYPIYRHAVRFLGEHITLNPSVTKDVGCAEAVSYVLKHAGVGVPKKGYAGTATLYDWLSSGESEFHATDIPAPGTIIIAPTGSNRRDAKAHGHVGIFTFGKTNEIASNSSSTGLFTENYSRDSWNHRYRDFPIYLFLWPHFFR